MDTAPKISIGLAIYNGENYMREAIDSLLSQTFSDFELIISDNASTDATAEICKAYASKDSRIRYHRNERNLGGAVNMNQTIRMARGEYFKLAAHDDNCAPEFLERCLDVLEREPSTILVHPKTVLIDENSELLTEPAEGDNDAKYVRLMNSVNYVATDVAQPAKRFQAILESYHYWYPIFGLVRTRELRQIPLFGTYPGGDQAFLARLSLRGRFHEVPEKLFFMRRHASQSINMGAISPQAYCSWYSTANTGKLILPFWKKFMDYGSALLKAPIKPSQKIRTLVYLFRAANWKAMLKDLGVAAIQIADYLKRTIFQSTTTIENSLLMNRYPRVTKLF